MYEKYFGNKIDGYFVEIGAYDGYRFSNTWGLAEAGWQGIYVEPIHELVETCREVHKNNRVITIECAISDKEGNAKIWLGHNMDYPSCTIDEESMRLAPVDFQYDPNHYRTVYAMTLDRLLHLLVPVGFDLLVIDVEGAEFKVLNSFTWYQWQPKMIIIEDHEDNMYGYKIIHTKEITDWFAGTSYKRIWHDVTNSIYVLGIL